MAKTVEIAPGVVMPMMGLGTFRVTKDSAIELAIDSALDCGYRLFDTAALYQNENSIGSTLATLMPKYKLSRADLFVTTKLLPASMGRDKTAEGFQQSLKDLRLDYVDLFLIHYPKADWLDKSDPKNRQIREETWRELEEIQASGKARAVGVSNYEIRHLEEIKSFGRLTPAVNQVEFHPHLNRSDLVEFCRQHHIHLQGFTPLGRNNPDLTGELAIRQAAERHNCPAAQILLSWAMAKGVSVVPKSADPTRIRSNFEATKIHLDEAELSQISALNRDVPYTSCRPWDVV